MKSLSLNLHNAVRTIQLSKADFKLLNLMSRNKFQEL